MIKAIVFDCFGVLAGKGYKRIYQNAGGDLEKDGTFIEETLDATNTGEISNIELNKRVAERLGKSPDEWHQIVLSEEQPNEVLLAYIKELKKHYKTAVLSNAYTGTLQRKFSKEQLALFDELVVSAEVGYIKPEPEIYHHTANKLGVNVTECVFIDDRRGYVKAAEEVGMKGVLYQGFDQMRQELEQLLAANPKN